MVMFNLLLMILHLKTMKDVINDKEIKHFFFLDLSDSALSFETEFT